MHSTKHVETVILDAGPLITQPASSLQQFANSFYTTPGVHSELKDDYVRQQLVLWGDLLKIKQPKQEYIDKVIKFAKLTGDYSVLSVNDLHIIALAYELEIESGGKLRSFPGEVLESPKPDFAVQNNAANLTDSDGFAVVKKKGRKRGGKRQREKREAEMKRLQEEKETAQNGTDDGDERNVSAQIASKHQENLVDKDQDVPTVHDASKDLVKESTQESTQKPVQEHVQEPLQDNTRNVEENLPFVEEEYNDSDDDGEWITPENVQEEMLKDQNEQIQDSGSNSHLVKVALATGDFACQNVAMQLGINLLNTMSGKQIKRVRNYMYRCHACFRLTPINKDGRPKHFCPKCGGDTLIRCAVSVDNKTGKITPHLKANFQWIKRGEKYSLPSPLSKNQQRLQGKGGYQHNKQNRHKTQQAPLILREDQKEYAQALKNDDWERRQNEKLLQDWIGGGSADNYVSPFGTVNTIRPSGVRVGKGRYVNSSRGKKK